MQRNGFSINYIWFVSGDFGFSVFFSAICDNGRVFYSARYLAVFLPTR